MCSLFIIFKIHIIHAFEIRMLKNVLCKFFPNTIKIVYIFIETSTVIFYKIYLVDLFIEYRILILNAYDII